RWRDARCGSLQSNGEHSKERAEQERCVPLGPGGARQRRNRRRVLEPLGGALVEDLRRGGHVRSFRSERCGSIAAHAASLATTSQVSGSPDARIVLKCAAMTSDASFASCARTRLARNGAEPSSSSRVTNASS